jgi:cell division septum initiation protein DivIVA
MKGRVRGLLGGGGQAEEEAGHYEPAMPPMPPMPQEVPGPEAQRAVHVLVLAQRTADEHVANAQHQANTIRTEARATAEQIARDAQAHAEGVRGEAAKALADARATAEQIVRDAQAHAEGARRDSDKIISDARAMAQEITKQAQANAAGLEQEAQQRYDDVVGSLDRKREALQQRIDTMEQFDRDYRTRLRKFMESQLRALGTDDPTVSEIQ